MRPVLRMSASMPLIEAGVAMTHQMSHQAQTRLSYKCLGALLRRRFVRQIVKTELQFLLVERSARRK